MYTESLKYIEHGIVVSVSPGKCLCLRNQHMRRKAAGSRRMHEAGKQNFFAKKFLLSFFVVYVLLYLLSFTASF